MSHKDDVRELLEDRTGRDNAITSSEILSELDLADAEGNPNIRSIITELIEDGEPIGASNKGYFYIESHDEFVNYLQSLDQRIGGIMKRKKRLREAYNG